MAGMIISHNNRIMKYVVRGLLFSLIQLNAKQKQLKAVKKGAAKQSRINRTSE